MGSPKFHDEDTHSPVHGPAIADGPDASLAAASARIDAILDALRSAGIIEQD